jgi:hypothetical protein
VDFTEVRFVMSATTALSGPFYVDFNVIDLIWRAATGSGR